MPGVFFPGVGESLGSLGLRFVRFGFLRVFHFFLCIGGGIHFSNETLC